MSGIKGNWGPFPQPKEPVYIGSAQVQADGTVDFISPVLGTVEHTAAGSYMIKPTLNIIPGLLVDVTQLGGPACCFGVVLGLGPDSDWINVQFNNPRVPADQDTGFQVNFYRFVP